MFKEREREKKGDKSALTLINISITCFVNFYWLLVFGVPENFTRRRALQSLNERAFFCAVDDKFSFSVVLVETLASE